ncbi:fibroblast growth factor 23-like [Thamnophis elegans]|uniref:fibroblast growth factor 23-like n=1 Tax=Thamnophis elegans TaxID=35005 RepID=UPI001378D0F9|nr:fibroblast growth factor 23-like [Thamnophis elegans]
MSPITVPALLNAFRLLLPLIACVWGPAVAAPNWSEPDELVHLYTSSSMLSVFLEIRPDGRVGRSESQTVDMVGYGRYIPSSFSDQDCVFKHTLFETNYDIYESVGHKFLVSLGSRKRALIPNRGLPRFSQFLQRRNQIPLSDFYTAQPQPEAPRDNGENPCGGILAGKIPEEVPLVNGIHPCFMEGEESDPLGVTLSKKFSPPVLDS